MSGTVHRKRPGRTFTGIFFWLWIIVMIALYLQTFESTIRLLAGAIAGWTR